jgi:hypothetical protein
MGAVSSKKIPPLSIEHFIGLPVSTVLRIMTTRRINVSMVAMKDGDTYNHSSKHNHAVLLYNPITNTVMDLLI